ncbi:hypothetical protein OURE66S_03776 [Oligella ureolytica]
MQTCEEALKEVSDKVWSRAIPGCDETKGEASVFRLLIAIS